MTAIKRKEKKGLFYLIAIAIMVAIMGISCSESPTTPANLSESGTGGGTDGGGAGIGGGTGTDGGYKVDVIYPEVAESLKNQGIDINNAKESDLDTIWKALAVRLTVNIEGEGASFYFANNGDMAYKVPSWGNQDDDGKEIKIFQKAVLVNGNNGYIIGGLYKVANINAIDSMKYSKDTLIRHRKIGFNITEGNYEVVYINNSKEYALIGNNPESTKNYSKDDFGITPDSYTSILKQRLNGIGGLGGSVTLK